MVRPLLVLTRPDGRDGYAVAAPMVEAVDPSVPAEGFRVGWMGEPGFGPIDADVATTVAAAAQALADLGCSVEPVRLAELGKRDCNAVSTTLFSAEVTPYFQELTNDWL